MKNFLNVPPFPAVKFGLIIPSLLKVRHGLVCLPDRCYAGCVTNRGNKVPMFFSVPKKYSQKWFPLWWVQQSIVSVGKKSASQLGSLNLGNRLWSLPIITEEVWTGWVLLPCQRPSRQLVKTLFVWTLQLSDNFHKILIKVLRLCFGGQQWLPLTNPLWTTVRDKNI